MVRGSRGRGDRDVGGADLHDVMPSSFQLPPVCRGLNGLHGNPTLRPHQVLHDDHDVVAGFPLLGGRVLGGVAGGGGEGVSGVGGVGGLGWLGRQGDEMDLSGGWGLYASAGGGGGLTGEPPRSGGRGVAGGGGSSGCSGRGSGGRRGGVGRREWGGTAHRIAVHRNEGTSGSFLHALTADI